MDFWKVLEYTSSVAIVGLLIWAVKLIFHDKLDARWHYFIWLVLLVRLIIPVDCSLVRTPVSVFQGIPLGRWIEYGRLWVSKKGNEEMVVMLGNIYLWGAALLGGYYCVTWAVLRISLKFAPGADKDTWKYVEDIAAKYGLRCCTDIRVSKCSTPYICGLIRPVLVLPEGNTRPEEPVIVHELLHGKWKDVAVNIGLHAVRVINWFHPVVWLLTGVVQNDSEALCDQRVLECYRGDMEREYGEMLLAMTRNKRRNPVKVGTSNMAGSYRNMRTRIRRICDFHRVPEGIGFVAFCITLMLAVSGIGASAEDNGFKAAEFGTETELQRELWKAQLYQTRTPEEAVYLFLRAAAEGNVFYRMAVIPQDRVEAFEEFAATCWRQGYLDGGGNFIGHEYLNASEWREYDAVEEYGTAGKSADPEISGEMETCEEPPIIGEPEREEGTGVNGKSGREEGAGVNEKPGRNNWTGLNEEAGVLGEWSVYFPGEVGEIPDWQQHRIYNLQYDEDQGTATVLVRLRGGEDGLGYTEWELTLTKEDGWKVWFAGDTGRKAGEFQEPSLFYDSTQIGDFLLGVSAYNEAYFDFLELELESAAGSQGMAVTVQGTAQTDMFPDSFSTEYKVTEYFITYMGQESLEGHSVRVEITEDGTEMPAGGMASAIWSGTMPGNVTMLKGDGIYVFSGDGYVISGCDGSALNDGTPYLLGGGGSGSGQAGQGWQAGDRICAHVRIYVDDRLTEEGEIWSENL